MPTATYIALANLTLTGSDAEISFTSIPNTYRDLVLVAEGTSTGPSNPVVKFNNDGGANYSWVVMSGTGSAAVSSSSNARNFFLATSDAYWDTTPTENFILHIMDYSATDKHKTILVRANNAGVAVDAIANRWASTSAVSSIQLTLTANSFASGSTFALYGIIS